MVTKALRATHKSIEFHFPSIAGFVVYASDRLHCTIFHSYKKSNTLALHKFPIPFSASASNQRDKDRAKQLKLNHRSKILLQFEQIFITLFCRANFLLHYLRYALNTIEISARWLWIWTVMQYVRLSCMMDFNLILIE